MEADIPVKDVAKIDWVIGIGNTLQKFQNDQGKDIFLPCVSYHLPTTDVRIFSPQTYQHMHGGNSCLIVTRVRILRDLLPRHAADENPYPNGLAFTPCGCTVVHILRDSQPRHAAAR